MNDPNVILSVDRDAGHRSEDRMIRKRLWPQGLYFEAWSLGGVPSLRCGFNRCKQSGNKCDQQCDRGRTDTEIPFQVHTVILNADMG